MAFGKMRIGTLGVLGSVSKGIQLSASSFPAASVQGTAIGTLSVVGGTGTYTFTLTDSATSKAQVAGTNGVSLQAGSASASASTFNITVHADNGAGSTFDKTFTLTAWTAVANTVAPAISGSVVQGATLAISNGTWSGFPAPSFTFQWKRAGSPIGGATASTYVVQNADVGSAITCTVTASNGFSSASATSAATATVTKTTLSYAPVMTGTNGSAYTGATPSTSGGTAPYVYSIAAGMLPTGTTLNTSTGVISGTPTVNAAYSGIVLSVVDANGVTDSSSPFTITVSNTPAFTGSGDVKAGAYAYWSVARAYNSAYAQATGNMVDLVDQAGANPITVNATSAGSIDIAAINAWVAANSVTTIKVKKLYDQTGNARDVSQATLANMPTLLLSHPALGNAAIPVMNFVRTSSQKLVSAATGLSSATGTFTGISRQPHYANNSYGGVIQAGSYGIAHTAGATNGITIFAGSTPSIPANDEIFLAHQSVFNGASSFGCVNGVVSASVNPGVNVLGSPFAIGTLNNLYPFEGQIGELRFDASVWSAADCTADYNNQLSFWFNRASHEGFVASRCRDRAAQSSSLGYAMARSAHIASEALTSIKVAWDNGVSSGTNILTQSIEYPAGTFTQLTWGGAASYTFRSGSDQIISDYATVSIPSGATFWVRSFLNNSLGVLLYNAWQNTTLGEAVTLSATSISDQTMGGTITNSGAYSLPPCGIIGVTTNKSVIILGDSIAFGTGDVETSSGASAYDGVAGYLARAVNAQGVTFVNMGRPAAQANNSIGRLVWSFGSHLFTEFGVNDLYAGTQSSAQLVARLHPFLDRKRPGQKAYQTTITPYTTSTDSWATVGNQTFKNSTQETQRTTFNTSLRNGTTGLTTLDGYIDAGSVFESALNSGKWLVSPTPPYTGDGLHPNQSGHTLAVNAGIVPTL